MLEWAGRVDMLALWTSRRSTRERELWFKESLVEWRFEMRMSIEAHTIKFTERWME